MGVKPGEIFKPGPREWPDEKRCVYVNKKTGERCKKPRMNGVTVCNTNSHGASLPNVRNKAARTRAELADVRAREKALSDFTKIVAADHPLANPIAAFEWDFRRTVSRIMYYDEKLAKVPEQELIWGMVRQTETEKDAPVTFDGNGGTNNASFSQEETEYGAQINMWEQMQFRERKHLLEMQKVWIAAKLDVRKLDIQEGIVKAFQQAITEIIMAVGKDPADPEIRNVIRTTLIRLDPEAGQ